MNKTVRKIVEHQIEENSNRCPVCGKDPRYPYYRISHGKIVEGCVSLHHEDYVGGANNYSQFYNAKASKEIRREQAQSLESIYSKRR